MRGVPSVNVSFVPCTFSPFNWTETLGSWDRQYISDMPVPQFYDPLTSFDIPKPSKLVDEFDNLLNTEYKAMADDLQRDIERGTYVLTDTFTEGPNIAQAFTRSPPTENCVNRERWERLRK